MDAFFASVEQIDNPDLAGKPVVVGSPSERGVIAAASYEARKKGVKSAMPSKIALRLCPDLIFVKHNMGRYKELSNQVFAIIKKFSIHIEAISIDEAFLDISNSTASYVEAWNKAEKIKDEIFLTTRLTASVGISYNKFLAKLASDMNKPNGLFLIEPVNMEEILLPLAIEKLYGIGTITAEKMHLLGIHTCKDLRNADADFLKRNFGKAGVFFFNISRGIDARVVDSHRVRKSVGAELTFDNDLTTNFQIIAELYKIEKILWGRILEHKESGRTLTIKVKFDDFKQITKSSTYNNNIMDFKSLHNEVIKLRKTIDFKRKKIRLMGVAISNLGENKNVPNQLKLWDE